MHAKYSAFALIVIVLSGLSAWVEASQSTSVGGFGVSAAQITVSGKVTDVQGKPVEGAKVTMCQVDFSASPYVPKIDVLEETTTGTEGGFTFSAEHSAALHRGVCIVARKDGLAVGWATPPRQGEQRLHITLDEPRDLTGQVVDEQGQPVAEAEVRIAVAVSGKVEDQRNGPVSMVPGFFHVKTDSNGRFVFAAMPAGATFEFAVEKPGRTTIATLDRTTYRGGKYQFSPGQAGIKLTLPLEARLEGVVVEKASGQPVGGVMVMAMPDVRLGMLLAPKTATTAQDGTFRIGALPAGAYLVQLPTSAGRITTFSVGVPLPTSPEKTDEWVAEPLRVTVKAGQTRSDLQLQLTKGGIFEVLVKDSVGKPVDRATVSVFRVQDGRSIGGQSLSGRTDGSGLAQIRVAPGRYMFAGAYKEGYPRRMGGTLRLADAIAVEEGETKRIEHVLGAGPKVTGIVRDEAGRPLDGVKFEVLPMMMEPGEIKSDAAGKFEVAWDPGMSGSQSATFVLVARDTVRNLAEAVELDEQGGPLDMKLKPGVVVTGTVLDQDGQPLPGARVRIVMQVSRWSGPLGRSDLAKAGADGKFEVKALPADRQYTVSATADGYGRGEVRVNPGDIQDNCFDAGVLKLVPATLSVAGVVVDPNDQPVAGASVYGYGEGQPDSRMIQTDAEGKFTIKGVCPGLIRLQVNSGGSMHLFGMAQAEGGATDLRIVISSRPTGSPYMPRRPTSLKGKPLLPLKDLGIDLPAQAEGKMLLVCFWDMGQRPSRNCLTQLAAQAAPLADKGLMVVLVHAAQAEDGALRQWLETNEIPFHGGRLAGDFDKTKLAWGVVSLPHLILTDKKHIVVAEGFSLDDLDKQIETAAGR